MVTATGSLSIVPSSDDELSGVRSRLVQHETPAETGRISHVIVLVAGMLVRLSDNPILFRPGLAMGLEFGVLTVTISGAGRPAGNGLQPYYNLPVHRGGSGFCHSFFVGEN